MRERRVKRTSVGVWRRRELVAVKMFSGAKKNVVRSSEMREVRKRRSRMYLIVRGSGIGGRVVRVLV